MDRRSFLTGCAGAAAGAALLGTGSAAAATRPAGSETVEGMPTVKLPRSGSEVPIFGAGCAVLMGRTDPLEERVALVRYAYERGVRYFDTASIYRTEPILGAALENVRDDCYLVTKTHAPAPEVARQHVEQSLRDLRTDRIDCVRLHCPPFADYGFRVLDELESMKVEGKIVNVGMSNHVNFETAFELIDSGRLDEVLLAKCYFPKGMREIISQHNGAWLERCIARAHQLGMNVIGMKALGAGTLTPKAKSFSVTDEDMRRNIAGAAIRQSYSDQRVHLYAIGCITRSDVDANVPIFSANMSYTDDDRMLLASWCTRAWESEDYQKMPEPYKRPGDPVYLDSTTRRVLDEYKKQSGIDLYPERYVTEADLVRSEA
jgi:aryl-alcohol dehydrogenase-like predicted oxidoreductase